MAKSQRFFPFPPPRLLLFALVSAAFSLGGCSGKVDPDPAPKDNPSADTDSGSDAAVATVAKEPMTTEQLDAVHKQVVTFCGDCHGTPEADEFPKSAWRREVQRGYDFYRVAERTDLVEPDFETLVTYYEQLAPADADYHAGLRQTQGEADPPYFQLVEERALSRATDHWIADVHWEPKYDGESGRIVYCDMKNGYVGAIDPSQPGKEPVVLAAVPHASHVETCDLNQDGIRDFIVSDLGDSRAMDVHVGQVIWLKGTEKVDTFEPVTLANRLSRTADARVGDFDGDSDLDVVVAEFGYLKTGRISYLENVSLDPVEFKVHVVDPRHGAINTIPIDIDEDGDLDFVAIVGQEHETIDVFLNDGKANFTRREIYRAKSASYGASSMELVDLDRDGDRDILFTNGDMFDGVIPRVHHGIHWLRNDGDLNFTYARITSLPGVMKAVPMDLDGDGDLDLAAVVMLPNTEVINKDVADVDAISLLINDGKQQFRRFALKGIDFAHATCAVGDFDSDGDPDLAVGNFGLFSRPEQTPLVDIYRNNVSNQPVTK